MKILVEGQIHAYTLLGSVEDSSGPIPMALFSFNEHSFSKNQYCGVFMSAKPSKWSCVVFNLHFIKFKKVLIAPPPPQNRHILHKTVCRHSQFTNIIMILFVTIVLPANNHFHLLLAAFNVIEPVFPIPEGGFTLTLNEFAKKIERLTFRLTIDTFESFSFV